MIDFLIGIAVGLPLGFVIVLLFQRRSIAFSTKEEEYPHEYQWDPEQDSIYRSRNKEHHR
jgi:hypothetical protein